MGLVYADHVGETTTTTGTGTYTLGGAITGKQSFSAGVGYASKVSYSATNYTDWEVGEGVITSAGSDILSRTRIIASSNSGNAVNWSAGTKDVFLVNPSSKISVSLPKLRAPIVFLPLRDDLHFERGNGSLYFERKSDATYINRNGLIEIVEDHKPRFEAEGLLIEQSSKNLALNSLSMDSDLATWSKGTDITRTGSYDGPTADSLITYPAIRYTKGTAPGNEGLAQAMTLVTGNDYVMSVWIRSTNPAGLTNLQLSADSGVDFEVSSNLASSVTTEWSRISFTFDVVATQSFNVNYAYGQNNSSVIELWGAQMEIGVVPTSVIPTSSAAKTRAEDRLWLDNDENWTQSNKFSIMADLSTYGSSLYSGGFLAGTYIGIRNLHNGTGVTQIQWYNGASANLADALDTFPKNQMTHMAISTDGTTDRLYMDGIEIDTGTTGTPSSLAHIEIGNASSRGTELGGHIKNFRIFDYQLTEDEIRALVNG